MAYINDLDIIRISIGEISHLNIIIDMLLAQKPVYDTHPAPMYHKVDLNRAQSNAVRQHKTGAIPIIFVT